MQGDLQQRLKYFSWKFKKYTSLSDTNLSIRIKLLMHKVQIRVTYGWSYSYRVIVISWCSTMVFACCFIILCVMTPLFCSLHILFTVRFTFNILDHSIDIGQVFGTIGGMLFSGSGDKSNNNTNENIPEGESKS